MPHPGVSWLARSVLPVVIELRRELHRNPEPANEEHRSTELIAQALAGEGLGPRMRAHGTGLWVDLAPRPRVGFRADIDALPIDEPPGNDPVSARPGWMHACGHDAHAAVAAGIAIAASRLDPPPPLRIFFQPAEESIPGGALQLIEEGTLDGLESLLAFHVDPTLETGRVGARPGPITAGADGLVIRLHGPGGHTSRPHRTADLVKAAARVVSELPEVIAGAVEPPVVTAFGSIHGGDAPNVIPTDVELKGTVRCLDPAAGDLLPGVIADALEAVLSPMGARFTLDYRHGVPPVVNDPRIVEVVTAALTGRLGPGRVVPVETSMGGEDFAYYLETVPGALLRLGSAGRGGDLHSSGFVLDENCLVVGVEAGLAALLALAGPEPGSGLEPDSPGDRP
jgi:amidohydrolase